MTSTLKTQAEKDQHKRARFKALRLPRVKAVVKRHRQLQNLANQSNYKFTKDEAMQAVKLYELMLEEAKEAWLEVDSYNLEKLFKPDTTELD
tara:strand:+ start:659 stop:934 length:276 start_codon:yes stop_codon:yes gene_type:complete